MVIWWTEESKNIIGSGITFLKAVRQGMVGMVTIGNSKPHNMVLHTLTFYPQNLVYVKLHGIILRNAVIHAYIHPSIHL